MKYLLLMFALLASGCYIYPKDYNQCVDLCKYHDGIQAIVPPNSISSSDIDYYCNDGVRFSYQRVK